MAGKQQTHQQQRVEQVHHEQQRTPQKHVSKSSVLNLPVPDELAGLQGVRVPIGSSAEEDAFERITRIRHGEPYSAIERCASRFGVPPAVLVNALGLTSGQTELSPEGAEIKLSPADSEKVLKAMDVWGAAMTAFHDGKVAQEWFLAPAYGLGSRRPLELLDTAAGAILVENYLAAIEFGNYW